MALYSHAASACSLTVSHTSGQVLLLKGLISCPSCLSIPEEELLQIACLISHQAAIIPPGPHAKLK